MPDHCPRCGGEGSFLSATPWTGRPERILCALCELWTAEKDDSNRTDQQSFLGTAQAPAAAINDLPESSANANDVSVTIAEDGGQPRSERSLIVAFTLWVIIAIACGPDGHNSYPPLPANVSVARSTTSVADSYYFAAENPSILKFVPCFCGCERHGHASNFDCFVESIDAEGRPTWSAHGAACAVCIDVALRARALAREGLTTELIAATIRDEFAAKWPSITPTPRSAEHGRDSHESP